MLKLEKTNVGDSPRTPGERGTEAWTENSICSVRGRETLVGFKSQTDFDNLAHKRVAHSEIIGAAKGR